MAGGTIYQRSIFDTAFTGHQDAYGVTEVGEMVDGKAESNSRLVWERMIPMNDHLNGKVSIGIAPLNGDGLCRFGAIDIDDYEYDLMDIVRAIYRYDLPLLPCWSKSRKLHVYLFFNADENPDDMVELLRWYAMAFGCGPRTEIFPKQTKLINTKFPSWINLPYFDAESDNHRKAVHADGSLVPWNEVLNIIHKIRISPSAHNKRIRELWFYGAPPCVLRGLMLMDVPKGYRNNWMFNVGVYTRLVDENDDYAQTLRDVNGQMHYPINELELENTVIKGLERNTYFYICNSMFRCDKKTCMRQEHGIGSKNSTGLSYGEMRQILTNPPTYEWDVNGQTMTFNSEQEIIGQSKFRALCMRYLHQVPRPVASDRWAAILTRAMENIITVDPKTASKSYYDEGETFKDLFNQYLMTATASNNIKSALYGNIVRPGDGYLYFGITWFTTYIFDRKVLRMTPYEILDNLRKCGCTTHHGSIMRVPEGEHTDIVTREEAAASRIAIEGGMYDV